MHKYLLLLSIFSSFCFSQLAADHVGVSIELGHEHYYHGPYAGYYYAPYAYPVAPVVYNPPVYVAPTPVYGEYYYHPYHHAHWVY